MSAEPLDVVLNRDRLNEALAPEAYTASGEFPVVLHNEGEPVHVHLRFSGPLAAVTAVDSTNHYVDGGATRHVHVDVADVDEDVTGTLSLVTGHGAETTDVAVTVTPPPEQQNSVAVDESLSEPPERTDSGSGASAGLGSDSGSGAGSRASGGASGGRDESGSPVDGVVAAAPDAATLLVAAFAVVVLAAAALAALALDSTAVTLGLVAVVVAVAVALYVLLP
ncbi:DUF7524 family protein [Halobaculum sp. P14]|uniref:DUF7524 family protein n=1 Tax=Halobaculum sp. P14 TaxID=3421638 RepID=UPI003EB7CDB4